MITENYIVVKKDIFKEIHNTYILSFSGGGWIGLCYYLGIIEYLIEIDFLKNNIIVLGSSAGSWASLILLYL